MTKILGPMPWIECRSLIALTLLLASPLASLAQQPDDPAALVQAQAEYRSEIAPLLQTYCYRCHNDQKAQGGVNLQAYGSVENLQEDRATWTLVQENIQDRIMPPTDPSPSDAEVTRLVTWIHDQINTVDCFAEPDPGRVTLRRLNRTAYRNTIRDLVGVEFDTDATFPADDVGYGFDNIGDVLSLPPILLEKYLRAAQSILDEAIVTEWDLELPVVTFVDGRLRSSLDPDHRRGPVELYANGTVSARTRIDQEGEYLIRVVASATQAGDEPTRMGIALDDRRLEVVDVLADENSPGQYQARVQIRRPQRVHTLTAEFLNDLWIPETDEDRNLQVERIELVGPIQFPSSLPQTHRRIFRRGHPPGDWKDQRQRDYAEEILADFARRAFRRPVEAQEIERLLSIYDVVRKSGDGFELAVQMSLTAVLISPHFLYQVEVPGERLEPGSPIAEVDQFDLASRLSYFLWSSMPDEELFNLAAEGQLSDIDILAEQVDRMLADPRARVLAETFATQWLTIGRLEDFEPDPEQFPAFDNRLRRAMAEETLRFFQAIVTEDRSIMEFLDSDFTFVNGSLAKLYGIAGVEGPGFQRVSTVGTPRGGILTQASVLSVTSNPTRTSPVKRGKWILEQILGTPPPPAPPGVPELEEGGEALSGTLREQMEQHRANPSCASCHRRMDPLGFGFENFDAIGAYRERDGAHQIDASGELPDGFRFEGSDQLKEVLLAKSDKFRRNLAVQMLTFALGRGLTPDDACFVDTIVEEVELEGDRFSALVRAIVQSVPFQYIDLGDEKESGS